MSHEILYTSAQRLLKPGMSGYGTVISTRGISSHLAEKLEALSGYRWAFELGDPQARSNPICFSHLIISVAGQRYHVLSRVSDYGADYSGRSNKIAHHVALSDNELTAGGPGWILKSPDFSDTDWDKQTRIIETGRTPTRSVRQSADYSNWKRLTGDAGWAGVLAETALSLDRKPVHIIFRLGTENLSLVEESLNLLPHRERWKVSFSTYYNTLPASVDCLWRFLLDGTAEANNIRRQPHQTVIDLTRPLGNAQGGELVERARESWQPEFIASGATPTRLPAKSTLQDTQKTSRPTQPPGRLDITPETTLQQADNDILKSYQTSHSPPVPRRKTNSYDVDNAANHTPWRLPYWAVVALCVLVGSGTGLLGFLIGKRSASPLPNGSVSGRPIAAESTKSPNEAPQSVESSPALTSFPKPDGNSQVEDTSATEGTNIASSPHPAASSETAKKPDSTDGSQLEPARHSDVPSEPSLTGEPNIPKKVDQNVKQTIGESQLTSDGQLKLPSWNGEAPKKEDLGVDIAVQKPEVVGYDEIYADGKDFYFDENKIEDKKALNRTWYLRRQSHSDATNEKKDPISNVVSPQLARMSLEDGKLLFQWDRGADLETEKCFQRCFLRLDSSNKLFRLSEPLIFEVGPLLRDGISNESNGVNFDFDLSEHFPNTNSLILTGWQLKNQQDGEFVIDTKDAAASIDCSKDGKLQLRVNDNSGLPFAMIDAYFRVGGRSTIEFKLYALVPQEKRPEDENDYKQIFWSKENKKGLADRVILAPLKAEWDKLTGQVGGAESKAQIKSIEEWEAAGTWKEETEWEAFVRKAWDLKTGRAKDKVIIEESMNATQIDLVKKRLDPMIKIHVSPQNLSLSQDGRTYINLRLKSHDACRWGIECRRRCEEVMKSMSNFEQGLYAGSVLSCELCCRVNVGGEPVQAVVASITTRSNRAVTSGQEPMKETPVKTP